MANGILTGSKGALIFAGAVILFAVAVAGALGDRFAPDEASEYGEEQSDDPATSQTAAEPASEPDDDDPYAEEDSLFGEYDASSEDEDLIDDTAGFGTSVRDEGDSPSEAEDLDSDDGDAAPAPRPRSSRLSPKASAIPANMRPEDISVEQMKRYLRQPPRIGKSEG